MFSVAFLTKRVPGTTLEQFTEHYGTTHYPLSSALPGLISYQQSLIQHGEGAWGTSEAFAGYDALSIYTFASRADADAAFASPEGLATDADTPLFMEWSSVLAVPVEVTRRFDRDAR
jgi:uncharacterized protein (TIGR02118 family)